MHKFLRLNLQWRVLALAAGAMTLILVLSAHLHQIITRTLIDDVRYSSAVSQTVAIAERTAALNLFADHRALERDIRLVATSQPDFVQIDVYQHAPLGGLVLLATTVPGAPPVPALDGTTGDNALGEMDRSVPGVVTMEVVRGGTRHWVVSVAIGERGATGYVTALVRKNPYSPISRVVQLQHSLVLMGALAACVCCLYLLFEHSFRRPAKAIVDAMAQARGGSFAVRAPVRRPDELGEIARDFNLLMEDLSARDFEREELLRRIEGFNETLRQEVAQATADLRVADEALLQSQQRLGRSERLAAMGQVAATIAHEIGTPLNSISGHVGLLARGLADDAEAQRRVRIINHQLESIVGSVRALLRRTHKAYVPFEPIDVNGVIVELLRLVSPTLDARGIVARAELADFLPPVLASRDGLQQVFLNLVNNSMDAMSAGGQLLIATRRGPNGSTEVVVEDTGPGIPAGASDRVFEPMWTTKATGSGFGLAIVRDIIAACGGQIEYDESLTTGARFRVRLPGGVIHAA